MSWSHKKNLQILKQWFLTCLVGAPCHISDVYKLFAVQLKRHFFSYGFMSITKKATIWEKICAAEPFVFHLSSPMKHHTTLQIYLMTLWRGLTAAVAKGKRAAANNIAIRRNVLQLQKRCQFTTTYKKSKTNAATEMCCKKPKQKLCNRKILHT